jgi:hypothetical protein
MKLLFSASAAACLLLLGQLQGAQGSPDRECPQFVYENGFVADAGLLADAVRVYYATVVVVVVEEWLIDRLVH